MADLETRNQGFGKVLVESIKTISDQKLQIAKKEISEQQDVFFQSALKKTQEYAEEIARTKVQEEVNSMRKDIFTLFGIFASFIAFIVGEINILKVIDSIYDKLGFSFIFVSLMLGFLFGVMFLINDEKEIGSKFSKMVVVFFAFFIFGICFILLGKF